MGGSVQACFVVYYPQMAGYLGHLLRVIIRATLEGPGAQGLCLLASRCDSLPSMYGHTPGLLSLSLPLPVFVDLRCFAQRSLLLPHQEVGNSRQEIYPDPVAGMSWREQGL